MIKKQDKQKLQQSSSSELQKKLTQLETELSKTRGEMKLGKLQDLKEAKKIRYQIALIKTVIREQELKNQSENTI